jgi:alpha-L-fucosidase
MKTFTCLLFLLTVTANSFAQSVTPKILRSEFIFETGKHFAQCHASSIEETKDGKLLATWFAGSREGNPDVKIWGSVYDGDSWSEPKIWADGISDQTYPCWNPVLFRKNGDSKVYLFYKVGPNPREWWGMVKESVDNGKTWSEAKKLPEGILGPIKNKPKQLANGTIIAPSSEEISETRWIAHVEIADLDMNNWKKYPINHESSFNVIQPSVLIHPDNSLQVLCRSREGSVISSWSKDNGITWSNLEKTNLVNPNSGTDAISVGKDYWIVYNPDIPGKEWWEGRAKLNIAASTDGMDWEKFMELENEDKGEYSYPTIFQDSKGKVHITYTFDRKNIKHVILEP